MSFIHGFLIAVPKDKKQEYVELARVSAPLFMDLGATRIVENWADDVPDGKVTDFKRAVKAEKGEAVVFSWIEWPDKDTYEAAAQAMQSDPKWQNMPPKPFDGKRMMWAGFEPVFDTEG